MNRGELAETLVTTTSHRSKGRRSRGGGGGGDPKEEGRGERPRIQICPHLPRRSHAVVIVNGCMEVSERGRESREGGRRALLAGSCRCCPHSSGIEARRGCCGGGMEGEREGCLARRRRVESVLTSSLGGRSAGEPRGGVCARASGAAAASVEEWSRQCSSGMHRGEKGKKIMQRREWRSLRHVRPGAKTRVGRTVSSISVSFSFLLEIYSVPLT